MYAQAISLAPFGTYMSRDLVLTPARAMFFSDIFFMSMQDGRASTIKSTGRLDSQSYVQDIHLYSSFPRIPIRLINYHRGCRVHTPCYIRCDSALVVKPR